MRFSNKLANIDPMELFLYCRGEKVFSLYYSEFLAEPLKQKERLKTNKKVINPCSTHLQEISKLKLVRMVFKIIVYKASSTKNNKFIKK